MLKLRPNLSVHRATLKLCWAFTQCVCVAVMHQDCGECILLRICCWGLSVDIRPDNAFKCHLPAGVFVYNIPYLHPYSCWINICIQHWWATLTKVLCAYAQTTSLLLTKGHRTYAHKEKTPLTKGLCDLSDPPYSGPHICFRRKIFVF